MDADAAGDPWREGARMFNDPEVSSSRAIDFMEENGLVEPNPAGVARLFREKAGPPAKGGLCKKEIGEYLSKLKPYNTDVRTAYAETFDFTGKSFVESLRDYLSSFRLPGESMLIERLFSSWAARFYRNNPQDFAPALLTPEKVEKYRTSFNEAATAAAAVAAASPDPSPSTVSIGTASSVASVLHEGWMGMKIGKKKAKYKRHHFQLCKRCDGLDELRFRDKPDGKLRGTIELSMCDAAIPGMEDVLAFDLMARVPSSKDQMTMIDVEYAFKCDDEQSCMVWVNRITMSLAMQVDKAANAAKERLAESGTVKWADLNDTVRSLGGDFKYLKDPDLEEMQNITAKELRFVAPCVGHELSFKEARDMVTRARKHEGTVDFITFLTMIAFKAGFDCAFVLAYTTIMLNTDAHNPRLKGQKRLTCAQFIENNRRSPDLATISDEYFAQLYDEIKMNEIKMNDDDAQQHELVDGPADAESTDNAGSTAARATLAIETSEEQYEVQQQGLSAALDGIAVPTTVNMLIGKTGMTFLDPSSSDVVDMLRYEQVRKTGVTATGLGLDLVNQLKVVLETPEGIQIHSEITRQVQSLKRMLAAPAPQMTLEEKARLGKWREAAHMFNTVSSTKAIDFMEENGLVEPNPAGVARLFREKAGPPAKGGLCKKEIGEYLSKLKPYNTDVRTAYAETFDFTGKSFVESLRDYLSSFRLPGESMLIERLFSSWAARFYRNNPQDFAPALLTPEKVEKYRTSFNEAATAAAAHDASSSARQPDMAGSATAGGGTAVVPHTFEVIHSGFMTKKGQKRKNWKRRYFEIRRRETGGLGDELVYMEKQGAKIKGKIDLSSCDAAIPGMEDVLGSTHFDSILPADW